MRDLLSAADYAAIARRMQFPSATFVDGAFRPAASGKTFETTNPATGKVLGLLPACEAADIDFAVSKAKQAFDDGRWHLRSPAERKAVLIAFAKLIERNRHELAVMESLDSGKPIRECQTVDVPDSIHTIRWHAELIDKIYDNTAPVGANAVALVVREPIGVVGLVLPWNFPLLMLAWKIGPALAAGCSVVVKPAEQTSLTALRVAELAHEAGVPAGVFNIVTGTGAQAGEPLGLHNDVAMISFTGSTATGRRFLRYAADSNLKRVVLECGGKNPAVVCDDAEDLDLVAEQVVNGAFWNMGENCSATSRLIVHASVKGELMKRIGAYMREWKMGDPLDPENRVGSLVSTAHYEKVASYIDEARAKGQAFAFGGATRDGIFVERLSPLRGAEWLDRLDETGRHGRLHARKLRAGRSGADEEHGSLLEARQRLVRFRRPQVHSRSIGAQPGAALGPDRRRQSARSQDGVVPGEVPKVDVLRTKGAGNRLAFAMHCDADPFKSADARNALKFGIDRQKIIDTVYKGFATIGCDTTIAPSNKYFSQNEPPHMYDPDKAKFLWKKAGGGSFELQVSEGAFPGATDSAILFQESLKAAGIDMTVKRVSGDGYWSNVWLKVPFCAVLWFSRASVDQQLSQTFLSQASWNDTDWRRPGFDKIVEAARIELDDAKRKDLYAQAQHMIADDGGMICFAVGDYLDGYSKKLQGAKPHPRFEMCDEKVAAKCWFA